MRKGRRCYKFGYYFSAFGLGMIIAMLCPKSFLVAVLSVAVVILGFVICR